jgi:hypothetical protein
MTTAELALLLDIGSAWTKGALIGRVGGRWRVVGHVAQPTAWGGRQLRRRLVAELAPSADHRLRDELDGLIRGATRIECHTARRPGRLALSAVSRELSAASARRAAEGAGWRVMEVATTDDGRPLAERLAALQRAEVDAWLIAGGFDEGRSPQALEAAALVAATRRRGGAPVIWAGSARLATEVERLFEDGAVTTVANPRPDARVERASPLHDHLEELLRASVEPERAAHLSPVAFRRGVAQLARASGLAVLGVDVGAHYATRVIADAEGGVDSRVFASGGIAGPALTAAGGPTRVARGLGAAIDELAVADALQNLRARPAGVPQEPDELAVIQAAARAQLAAMIEDSPVDAVDLLLGAGRVLAAAPHPGDAMQMLLDGIRPQGVTQVAVDAANVIGPLGALDDADIDEGLALLGDDLLVPLGTAVVSRGGVPGQVAMRVTVHRAGWPDTPAVEVRTGQLQVLPLARGQRAELAIEPADGVSLGTPRRSPRLRAEAVGGLVGLVLDARGVPPALPRRPDDRREVMAGWRETFLREPAGAERRP